MKKIIMIIGLASFAIAVSAQPPQQPTKPPGIEENLKNANDLLDKKVKPDSAQKIAIYNAFKNFYTRQDQLRKNNPNSKQPGFVDNEAIENLVKDRDESVKMILTKAQFKKYKRAVKRLDQSGDESQEDQDRNEPPPPPDGGGEGGEPPSGQ